MTNGDRIRAMSDEELVGKLVKTLRCNGCPAYEVCVDRPQANFDAARTHCRKTGLIWLAADGGEK